MSQFITINGRNGWSAQGSSNLYAKIREVAYDGGKGRNEEISVVALGRDDTFCIVTENGSWRSHTFNSEEFGAKMRSLDPSQIKMISFGPSDSYAIVMKNGFCHARAFEGNDGPLTAINKHQNDIKYVAMTANKGEWIVGYGTDAYTSVGMDKGMLSYLDGAIAARSDEAISMVQLGRKASWWMVTTTRGSGQMCFASDSDFQKSYSGCRIAAIW